MLQAELPLLPEPRPSALLHELLRVPDDVLPGSDLLQAVPGKLPGEAPSSHVLQALLLRVELLPAELHALL